MKTHAINFMIAVGALSLLGCSNDDPKDPAFVIEDGGVKITVENLKEWTAYAEKVADDLNADASKLLTAWETQFGQEFKQHMSAKYPNAKTCIEEIIDGCGDIAGDVGEDKIGDPLKLLLSGNRQQALLQLESWFSWHSRDDYANNILSIRNSYLGSLDGSVSPASMSALVAAANPALNSEVISDIDAACKAIMAVPEPFANNLTSQQAKAAIAACTALENVLDDRLEPFFEKLKGQDKALDLIVANYVDGVVLPTYKEFAAGTAALLKAVQAMNADPTAETFDAAAKAWYAARTPWEQSEAFLFGPVEALGLARQINQHPVTPAAVAAQTATGFHALEYLLFADGAPRRP